MSMKTNATFSTQNWLLPELSLADSLPGKRRRNEFFILKKTASIFSSFVLGKKSQEERRNYASYCISIFGTVSRTFSKNNYSNMCRSNYDMCRDIFLVWKFVFSKYSLPCFHICFLAIFLHSRESTIEV
jgi:hypothetical protein